jgi:hypothetical protein
MSPRRRRDALVLSCCGMPAHAACEPGKRPEFSECSSRGLSKDPQAVERAAKKAKRYIDVILR